MQNHKVTVSIQPVNCSSLRIGDYVILRGSPCKITRLIRCAPSKHGHGRSIIIGRDLFNDTKITDHCYTQNYIDTPIVKTVKYYVLDKMIIILNV